MGSTTKKVNELTPGSLSVVNYPSLRKKVVDKIFLVLLLPYSLVSIKLNVDSLYWRYHLKLNIFTVSWI